MAEESRTYPLVEALMRRSPLPRFWTIIAVNAVLLLGLILVAALDDTLTNLSDWRFWQLSGLANITYILVVHPFMWRLRGQAIQAFRPLLSLEDGDFNRLAAEVSAPNRRWEWTYLLIGVGLAVALGQPWTLGWGPGHLWMAVYLVIVGALFNGLLAWLIYDTLAGTVRISRLSRRDLKLDIFDTELLTPIARWSLGISLAFVGGISLSLVFQTRESLLRWQSLTMYAILVGALILMFLLSMWSAHNAMANAKNRKLAMARKHLAVVSRELEDRAAEGQLTGTEGLSATITSWATYQRLVQEAPAWPFNASIIRRLAASIFVPAIVYLIKILSGLGLRF